MPVQRKDIDDLDAKIADGKTILLVDDDQQLRQAVKRVILATYPQLKVVEAKTGAEGLKKLSSSKPDVILADYQMPVMDGLEFLKEAAKVDKTIPRVMITGVPGSQLSRSATEEGHITTFLGKPVDADTLIQTVTDMLRERWLQLADS